MVLKVLQEAYQIRSLYYSYAVPHPVDFTVLHLFRCNYIVTYVYNKVNGFCTRLGAEILVEDLYIMNKEIEKAVGNNIRILREKAGITQGMLSARLQVNGCDITRSALAKIEVGQRHLYPDEIILLKKLLKVSYEDIFSI